MNTYLKSRIVEAREAMDLAYSRMTNIAMMNTVGKSAKERVAIDLDYAYAELDFAVKEQKYKELLDAHLPS